MTKRIVLCADDYGQAEAASSGILDLLALGRLSATSCIVTEPQWPAYAARLTSLKTRADIGLHLNFTEGQPLSALYREKMGSVLMPLSALLWRAMIRPSSIYQAAIMAEINAQLDAFQHALGFLPRFVDGHQHVHHLPVISDALLAIYRQRLRGEGVYIRAVTLRLRWWDVFRKGLKPAVIHYTGGRRFAGRLDAVGITHNTTFSGIYHFSRSRQYRHYFQRFLRESVDGGLIMCHPGREAKGVDDPISKARFDEYQYFKSDDFLQDCERFGIVIAGSP